MAVRIPLVTTFSAKGIKSAIKEFKALNSNLDRARFLTRRLLLPATAALTASTVILGKVLFDAAKAAAADEASQKTLERQLMNTTRATSFSVQMNEKFLDSLEKASTVAGEELRPSLARLAAVTGDVTKAQQLLSLAVDVSAGSGKSLDETTGVLVQAMLGNFKGLKQLGIEYTSTGNRAKDFKNIVELLQQQFGGAAAAAADTFQGKMRILGHRLGDLQEAIGHMVLPALTKFVDVVTQRIVPALTVFIDQLGQKGVKGAFVGMAAAFQIAGLDIIAVLEKIVIGFLEMARTIVKVGAPLFVVVDLFRSVVNAGKPIVSTQGAIDIALANSRNKFTALKSEIANTAYQMDLFAAASGNVNNAILGAELRLEGFGRKVKAIKPPVEETDDAFKGLGGSIDRVKSRAEKMADALRDRMAQALEDAKDKLRDAQAAFDDFKGGVSSAISGVVNFGDAAQTSAERGGVTFFDALQEQADKAKAFGNLVDQLLAAGLSKEALQQVLDAGQEAGSFIAKELLKSSENILRANKLVEETTKIAQEIGQRSAEKFFQAGVANAAAYLKGVEETIAKAEAMLRKVGLKPADVKGVGALFDDSMTQLASPLANATLGAGVIPSTTSVVVNTVTAPSNLGDIIVDALRDYNRRSGPLQLEIE